EQHPVHVVDGAIVLLIAIASPKTRVVRRQSVAVQALEGRNQTHAEVVAQAERGAAGLHELLEELPGGPEPHAEIEQPAPGGRFDEDPVSPDLSGGATVDSDGKTGSRHHRLLWHPLDHLFYGELLLDGAEMPDVTERILEAHGALAVELVGQRPQHCGTGFFGPPGELVHVLDIYAHAHRRAAELLRALQPGSRTLVGKIDRSAFDPDLRVPDGPAGTRKPHRLLGAERLLVEVDGTRRSANHQVGDGGRGILRVLGHGERNCTQKATSPPETSLEAAQLRALEPKDVEVFNRTVSRFSDGTRAGLRLSASAGDGVAYVRGIELGDGTIELDVKPSRPEALLAGGRDPAVFQAGGRSLGGRSQKLFHA